MATTTSRDPGSGAGPLARYFALDRYKVTVGSEMMAGLTTFLVMAYIAFVNPGILTSVPDRTGFRLDFGATVTATCWVAGVLCILMGVFARRPFAMAPGLGLNAVVTYQLVAAQGLPWSQAMGIVVLEGIIITLLVLTRFRQAIMNAVPLELKHAIAAGIGLFILYIGLNNGGFVSGNPTFAQDPTAPPVMLGNFSAPALLVSVFGLLLVVWLFLQKTGRRCCWASWARPCSPSCSTTSASPWATAASTRSKWVGAGCPPPSRRYPPCPISSAWTWARSSPSACWPPRSPPSPSC